MIRFCLALGTLVAAAGCLKAPSSFTSAEADGAHLSRPGARPGGRSRAPAGESAIDIGRDIADARPIQARGRRAGADVLGVTSGRRAGFYSRMTRGVGYYWIGYSPVNVPMGDLIERLHPGSGDGISVGVGLKFTESARAFMEIAVEKTYNHDLPATDVNAYNQHVLLGGRVAAAPRARMEKQPRAYVSYGVSTGAFAADGIYDASSFGFYCGMGVEFPSSESQSFAFDAKYHTWRCEDNRGVNGVFATTAISLLWLSRF